MNKFEIFSGLSVDGEGIYGCRNIRNVATSICSLEVKNG